ncbi:MAG: HDOD domain-containing protein [Gammaproteobacteria bacterium]|nr:HDOD domain-containing protein [Gammaproteobacteria bacterium]MDH5801107.1 HDOD domain-containing protein [Gammaproteobacteria bacterium]
MSTINGGTLGLFFPLCYMNKNELELLAQDVIVFVGKKGKRLVEQGSTDHKALYLIKGKVCLETDDGKRQFIEEYTRASKSPVSFSDPHKYTVTCDTTVEFMRIDNHIIDNLLERHRDAHQCQFDYSWLNNPLFFDIYRDLSQDALIIPTLPKLALNIRKAIDDDADLRKIEILIQADPTLATILIRTANSALYKRDNPAETIEKAIIRLGMQTIKSLVTHYSLKSLFRTESTILKARMHDLWIHSTEVAAMSFVLARKLMTLDPEHALLLGLLHNVGALPLLSYADKYSEFRNNPEKLDKVVVELSHHIGALVFDEWGFPEDFVQVAKESNNWGRESGERADYCDLIIAAKYHTLHSHGKTAALPPPESVPALRKLGLIEELSDNERLLSDVKNQVWEVRRMLSM